MNIIGPIFLIYMVVCMAVVPLFIAERAIQMRDCRLIHGAECTWQLVPNTETNHDR